MNSNYTQADLVNLNFNFESRFDYFARAVKEWPRVDIKSKKHQQQLRQFIKENKLLYTEWHVCHASEAYYFKNELDAAVAQLL